MISFAVEVFSSMYMEMRENLLQGHYEELSLDRGQIGLSFEWARYLEAERSGILHVVTVRDDARLVGYFVGVVMPHLHYHEAGPMCHTDVYYLLPEYRKGYGLKLFTELERTLKERGVTKIYLSCKVHQDHSALFEGLGYRFSDKIFTKLLN